MYYYKYASSVTDVTVVTLSTVNKERIHIPRAERLTTAIQVYWHVRPQLRAFKEQHTAPIHLLDAGCGDGVLTRQIASDLAADEVLFVDCNNSLRVPLLQGSSFHSADVSSKDFRNRFQGKANIVTSIAAFHEFNDPFQSVSNFLSVVPQGGSVFIVDRAQEGWMREEGIATREGEASLEHHQADLKKLADSGLGTDKGIRDFWEGQVFPNLPLENGKLTLNEEVYVVSYQRAM